MSNTYNLHDRFKRVLVLKSSADVQSFMRASSMLDRSSPWSVRHEKWLASFKTGHKYNRLINNARALSIYEERDASLCINVMAVHRYSYRRRIRGFAVLLVECGDPYCGQDVSLNIYIAPCCYQIRFKIHVDWRAMDVDWKALPPLGITLRTVEPEMTPFLRVRE